MRILTIRLICFFWTLVCLGILVHSYLLTPLSKLPTEMAMQQIENKYIHKDSMTEEQLKNYNFLSSWILGNDLGFKRAARERHKIVTIIAVGSTIICLYLVFFLKKF